ncbi:lysosomal alpha-mannosidase isoform X2 [Leptinotarsa decemlineata]
MVNGAWSMNDEACSNYQSTIDQFTWGLRIIDDILGKCGRPTIGWQIDPFGHSREQASLLSQMGYDGVFFARLDHDDLDQRKKDRRLDFVWQGSDNLDNSTIYGGIFATDLYNSPPGYCWDIECEDDVIVDDPKSPNYNLEGKVSDFLEVVKNFSNYFSTNNIFIPMGGDFQYQAAETNYINMDRFIKGFADHKEVNVIYSTPSCYLRAVNKAKPTLTLKTDDFFPYSNSNHSFWAGYFTSRPNSKRFERVGHNILQASKQLYALGSLHSSVSYAGNLIYLKEVMGVMQHHDAITGTEQQHVANDYVRMLTASIEEAEKPLGDIVGQLLNLDERLNLSSCLLSNISICKVSQDSDQFVVVVYNPLAWNVTHYVRLPMDDRTFEIRGPNGIEVFDLVPSLSKFEYVKIHGAKPAPYDLVFAAKDIPPMGLKLYHVTKKDMKNSRNPNQPDVKKFSAFSVNPKTNLLESVTLNGKTLGITQNFNCYHSDYMYDDSVLTGSGAYLFVPNDTRSFPLGDVSVVRSFSGNHVEEIHQMWKSKVVDIHQSIRWYKNEEYIELDWIIGNIKVNKVGIEVISRFTVTDDFDNKNTFYTDSNGREMIKRMKNHRSDYKYDHKYEPVASNYYPVTSKLVIKDEHKNIEVAILNDRSQGGSSLGKNNLELMVHRRVLFDDNKGVNEYLSEVEFGKGVYARGSHYLIVGNAIKPNLNGKSTAAQERILAQKKLVQPWIGLAPITESFDELTETSKLMYSGLARLPDNINILTFEPWKGNTYLLRLEHIMEKNEDAQLSDKVILENIQNIFKHFRIEKMDETTLAANVLLKDFRRSEGYNWQIANASTTARVDSEQVTTGSISLKPMEIKTFIVRLEKKSINDLEFM